METGLARIREATCQKHFPKAVDEKMKEEKKNWWIDKRQSCLLQRPEQSRSKSE